ncbi:MAG: hypothetical protein HQL98_14260 [Magnetococcales bacterium]|nr:hypothetical protein [Magnetococcales bacterium]
MEDSPNDEIESAPEGKDRLILGIIGNHPANSCQSQTKFVKNSNGRSREALEIRDEIA